MSVSRESVSLRISLVVYAMLFGASAAIGQTSDAAETTETGLRAPQSQRVVPPNPVTARIVIQTGHASAVSAVAWTSDGRFLVTGSTDSELRVWDLAGHVIARATLGSPNDRSAVEKIVIAPDGRSVAVSELYFKDMWDNGIGSELHRRSYTYRFGDAAAVAGDDALIDPPWKPGTAFLAGSRALKAALFNRTDLPKSATGWALKRVGAVLMMVPPAGAGPPVQLTGPLGGASDEGDRRLERIARDFELREAAEIPGSRPAPPAPRDVGPRSGPPILSPDGNLMAWLETSGSDAIVHLLDMQAGAVRPPVRFSSTATVSAIGWTGANALVAIRTPDPPIAIDAVQSRLSLTVPTSPVIDPTAIAPCAANAPASDNLCLTRNGRVEVRNPAGRSVRCEAVIDEGDPIPATYASTNADRSKVVLQSASGYTSVFDVSVAPTDASPTPVRRCRELTAWRAIPGRVGFHPTKPLIWMEGRGGALSFLGIDAIPLIDPFTGRGTTPMLTLYRLPNDRFFVIDELGRYDTNLGPDAQAVRWQVSDLPFETFPAQTFMRDYFEPRLMARRTDCSLNGTCADAFRPIQSIAQLNRVLPTVEIGSITPGPTPNTAWVETLARPGSKPEVGFGKTSSAIYDLRLFRDGSLVARLPGVADRAGVLLPEWRSTNLVPIGPDGVAHFRSLVALPTRTDVKQVRFSAYAFNEDRIKSETAALTYDRPATTPQARRAYVLTIGIDAYDDPRLKLRFAARDADLTATRLAAIPGFGDGDVRRVALTAPASAQRSISKETIAAALGILAGSPRGPLLDQLRKAGFDASALDAASPDDIVIVAYAGHGWADKTGNFFLIPSDAKAIDPTKPPDTARFVSAVDLGNWLRTVDAGEIALIIDACNSAASVDAGGFKPGPMGDANLGQLAFDKGIRILAATQNADVALEDEKLGHGLLTWALAAEGIDGDGFGRADRNKDGAITLDEWLRYATERLPGLSEDVRLKRYSSLTARDFDLVPLVPVERPKPQEPALFDFTGRPSSTVLRRRAP